MDRMIQDKVEKANITNAVAQLAAKVKALTDRRNRMLSPNVPHKDKKREVVNALATCKEIAVLFGNSTYAFLQDVIPSSEYLLNFAAIYLESMRLSVGLIPSYKDDVKGYAKEMISLLKLYREKCSEERCKQVYAKTDAYPYGDGEYSESFGDKWGVTWERVVWIRPASFGVDGDIRVARKYKEALDSYRQRTRAVYWEAFSGFLRKFEELIEELG